MPVPAALDHLVVACRRLEVGVAHVAALLRATPAPGGAHPGVGTRNALLGLGDGRYLEVIAVDPEQPPPAGPRPFGIDELDRPRLAGWVCRRADPETAVRSSAELGWRTGDPRPMSRRLPDGAVLRWQLALPARWTAGGVVPGLIDWGATPRPARTLPPAGRLVDLRARHPDPERVRRWLAAIEVPLVVELGEPAGLLARIEAGGRVVELS